MRLRRWRGFGCLGCLPFTGLFGLFLPLLLLGALVYFLMNRQKFSGPGRGSPQNPAAAGGFCSHCGQPLAVGTRFCAGCGNRVDGA